MELKIDKRSFLVLVIVLVIWEIISIIYFGFLGFIGLLVFSWILYRANKYSVLVKRDIIALLIMIGLTAFAFYLNYIWLPEFVADAAKNIPPEQYREIEESAKAAAIKGL